MDSTAPGMGPEHALIVVAGDDPDMRRSFIGALVRRLRPDRPVLLEAESPAHAFDLLDGRIPDVVISHCSADATLIVRRVHDASWLVSERAEGLEVDASIASDHLSAIVAGFLDGRRRERDAELRGLSLAAQLKAERELHAKTQQALHDSAQRLHAVEKSASAIIEIDIGPAIDLFDRWRRGRVIDTHVHAADLADERMQAIVGASRIVSANRAAKALLGVSEPLKPERSLRGILEHCCSAIARMVDATVAGERSVELTGSIDRPGLPTLEVLVHARLPSGSDRPCIVLAGLTDVTTLKRTLSALESADRRKNEFLAMLAHELRNPLAPIRYAAEILKVAGGEIAAVTRVRDVLERQVQQLSRMVDDLLDVSRIIHDKLTVERMPVRLQDVVRDTVEATREAIRRKELQLTVSMDEAPATVEGDPVRLTQVLSNVISNAVKFTPAGGHIELALGCHRVRGQPCAWISVKDDGEGIDPAALPQVFDLFVQGRTPQAPSSGGLGIGLTIARRLVEMHGGRLRAQSDGIGRGACFTLELPLMGSGRGHLEPMKAPGVDERLRVIVVDDDPDSAESLSLLLELEGCDVRTTSDGAQALAMLDESTADAVILDIALPDMDGHALARRIRARPGPRCTLIAVSGYGRADDFARSRDAGIDHHLVKPVNLGEVMTALRNGTAT